MSSTEGTATGTEWQSLAAFLLDRLTEDEQVARKATAGPWQPWLGWMRECASHEERPCDGQAVFDSNGDQVVAEWMASEEDVRFIARFDPARVLVECEGKRNTVLLMQRLIDSFERASTGRPGAAWPDVNRRERSHARSTLLTLAEPYADHPDFRQEWRP